VSLYSPTNPYPSNISINAATPTIFTWDYQGSTAQTDYQIKIYLNSDNSLVYDSTKTASSNEYHTLPSSTLINNNIYKYTVETWSGAISAKSNWILVYANAPATLTIGATPSSVQQYTFSSVYNSTNLVPVKTYEAKLYLSATPSTTIAESGILYPTGLVYSSATPLTHLFDGLISGNSYSIQFTCENQRGELLDTGLVTFPISYTYPTSIPALTVTPDNSDGSVTLNWVALVQKLGFVTGTFSYVAGKFDDGIQLDAGTVLYYPTETIPDDATTYYWVKLPANYNGVLLQFGEDSETGMRVFFTGTKFGWSHGDFITIGRTVSDVVGEFVLIGIKYRKLLIKSATHEEIIDI
jgi:hypothetical protein